MGQHLFPSMDKSLKKFMSYSFTTCALTGQHFCDLLFMKIAVGVGEMHSEAWQSCCMSTNPAALCKYCHQSCIQPHGK